jgi:hypothetical protein
LQTKFPPRNRKVFLQQEYEGDVKNKGPRDRDKGPVVGEVIEGS